MQIQIDTDTEIITIDGMAYTYDFFSAFSNPDPRRLYSFEEVDGAVVANLVSDDGNNYA